ncbi:transcriptional regulator, MucR family [Sphingomonas laterariae]|uniref:Transcriptional regulator, MucR family n=1 Tax=Edaphosphingomonas laterariae TaxID=861865 RepID=A0A239G9E1_9SPHN|nr:MucR family transcriptional regulator [Sphingomonas laterariae]SNS65555.1 transcriptional regulator, MucR family [Sphingomonas laterariae]
MTNDLNRALVEITADIVSAHVSNNVVSNSDVPHLIQTVHDALSKLSNGTAAATETEASEKPTAAVGIRKSTANPEFILSMIDGKPYKSLKRHIGRHGYTPESYREAFGLPANYPLVAPSYSEHRRAVAKQFGLGRKKSDDTAAAKPVRKPRKAGV